MQLLLLATKALKDVVVPCAWFPYSTERDVNGNSYNTEIKLVMKRNYKNDKSTNQ